MASKRGAERLHQRYVLKDCIKDMCWKTASKMRAEWLQSPATCFLKTVTRKLLSKVSVWGFPFFRSEGFSFRVYVSRVPWKKEMGCNMFGAISLMFLPGVFFHNYLYWTSAPTPFMYVWPVATARRWTHVFRKTTTLTNRVKLNEDSQWLFFPQPTFEVDLWPVGSSHSTAPMKAHLFRCVESPEKAASSTFISISHPCVPSLVAMKTALSLEIILAWCTSFMGIDGWAALKLRTLDCTTRSIDRNMV